MLLFTLWRISTDSRPRFWLTNIYRRKCLSECRFSQFINELVNSQHCHEVALISTKGKMIQFITENGWVADCQWCRNNHYSNVLFCTNCHRLWFSFRCNYPSPLAYSKCLAQRASVLVLLQRWTSLNLLIDAAVPLFCSDCHCYRHLFSITIVIVFYWHPVSLSSIVILIFLTPSNLLISLFIAIAINCLFHLYWLYIFSLWFSVKLKTQKGKVSWKNSNILKSTRQHGTLITTIYTV